MYLGCRAAQEAEALALAKEQEAHGLLPVLEEHERTIGPLQNEAATHQRCTAVPVPLCTCPVRMQAGCQMWDWGEAPIENKPGQCMQFCQVCRAKHDLVVGRVLTRSCVRLFCRTRAEAEEKRAALVRELEALDAALGGHRCVCSPCS